MKKRLLSAVLAAFMLICFAACTPPAAKKADIDELWNEMEGVWVYTDTAGVKYFVWFKPMGQARFYNTGILESGFIIGGEGREATVDSEGVYTLTVDFPAVEPTEENSGYGAFTEEISLQHNPGEKTAKIKNIAGNDDVQEFTYIGVDLEDANEKLFYGNLAWMWGVLKGIWVNKNGDYLDFIAFYRIGDYWFTMGTFYSDYTENGIVTDYMAQPQIGRFTFTVDYPGEEGGIAYSRTFEVDYTEMENNKILYLDTDTDKAIPYKYSTENYGFPIDFD
ncbi:MAG: hypothetical protein IKT01_00130 [Eubacteriaceae bacterium]|nr:hypothetical protein [Eubacteriaceae bacterium]